jgi:hypothetical protein
MKAEFIKQGEALIAISEEAKEFLSKKKNGTGISGEFKEIRNYRFHKKYFALLNYAYDHWEPGEINSKYGTPEKTFKQFRKDLTILAGFYNIEMRINREPIVTAKSISFAKMSEDDFEKLYSNTIDVILKYILTNYKRSDLEQVVLNIIGYG